MLNLKIFFNKRKLEKMIDKKVEYNKILEQSQKLDILINKKMKKINNIKEAK